LGIGFKGNSGNAMLQTYQGGEYATQAVPSRDDVCIWIDSLHFFVEFDGCLVVSIWLPQLFSDTLIVTRVSASHAVTALFPPIRATLPAAAGAKKVVVLLVMTRRAIALKHGDCGAFYR
jgi:hypothetical protein